MSPLMIDPEFESLITPLKPDEYAELEKSILEEGCRDPIITWKGVIVDGHNRYTICQKHDLEFKTVERDFESRDDAKVWMIRNQIGRRNLNNYERSRLALKMKPLISKVAKKNQACGQGGVLLSQNSVKAIDTSSSSPLRSCRTAADMVSAEGARETTHRLIRQAYPRSHQTRARSKAAA